MRFASLTTSYALWTAMIANLRGRRVFGMNTPKLSKTMLGVGIVGIVVLSGAIAHCSSEPVLSEGATVYVPVYSHIYVGFKGKSFDLAIALSIRNTDPAAPISILSVAYYDSSGKLVRNYAPKPVDLPPLASTDFFVSESDTTGGFGAAFVVKWKSRRKVNQPIIEGVMVSTRSGQGISFTSRGQVIEDRGQ
jgi:hypothetical protein